jgi:hypothetical protein
MRFELEADDGEFRFPHTAHFIATVEDLTDMLDYDSEDIDGMDDDAGEEQAQNPPFTGRWTASSSYDVYMADTPAHTVPTPQDVLRLIWAGWHRYRI